jgi:hypothetical protein
MREPDWYPNETYYNIYNREDFKRGESGKALKENSSGR